MSIETVAFGIGLVRQGYTSCLNEPFLAMMVASLTVEALLIMVAVVQLERCRYIDKPK